MKVDRAAEVNSQSVMMDGANGCSVRWLINDTDGAPNFAMRQFAVEPEGHTPKHSHPYEHEVYVLSGSGIVLEGDEEHPIAAGDFIYVRPDEIHQFRNTGTAPLTFLCMVPHIPEGTPVNTLPECEQTGKE
ncbi:MAG: cupin domain-containing protein [Pirellulales bacterium]|jgi:quercetin dioxygenase-like cupin family protein|nr:cupin domain-containing protein [Pirellulales bacterium]